MLTKKKPGSADWTDPDDAPPLTREMRERAEVFDGDRFVQRGRGRPKSLAPKEQVNIRLDAAVLGRLRRSGPGWQSRAAAIVAEKVDEATMKVFDFPVEFAVTLPSGEVARRTGIVSVRASDHAAAAAAFDTHADARAVQPLLHVRLKGGAPKNTSAKPQR
jgi:uncharacterized protein (DUF4415 family)